MASKTRLATIEAANRERAIDGEDAVDTSGTPPGKRHRALIDAAETSERLDGYRGKGCLPGDPDLASVVEKEWRRGMPNDGILN